MIHTSSLFFIVPQERGAHKEVNHMNNNRKPSEPVEEERWALKEVNTMKNPLAVQILALSIQILALVVILLKK